MKLSGQFHEVTNLPLFAASSLAHPDKPDPASFKAMAGVRVFLITDFPLGFTSSFIPGVSMNVDTNANGAFSLPVPDAIPGTAHGFVLATHLIAKVAPFNVPIFAPIYRSATFKLSQIDTKNHDFFVSRQATPPNLGITQAQVNQLVGASAKTLKVDSLSAFINDGSVGVVAKGEGATVKFDILLNPFTGPDLGTFVSEKIDNMDIDLPGPDAFVGLCVSKDKIAAEIQKGVHALMPGLNKNIKDSIIQTISQQTGQPQAVIKTLFDQKMTLTFEQVRFPVIAQKTIGPVTVKFRSIAPDVSFGFPHNLFS